MALSASSFLDDYYVIPEFRRGRFGKVLKVKNKKSGELFARREFEEQLVGGGDVENEINTLTNLGINLAVVQLIEFDRSHLLMEFCDLGDLDNFVRRNRSFEIESMMEYMISGLTFLHNKGIVHGDLKPANVLLQSRRDTSPICKISDYGMWKFVRNPSTHPGSQYYMAPGVGTGTYKKADDVFSLGSIFFVLFTKQWFGSGEEAYLAPTITKKKLHEVTDEETTHHVMANPKFTQKGFGKLIIQMLKHDDKGRLDISGVNKMFFGEHKSLRRLQVLGSDLADSRENSVR